MRDKNFSDTNKQIAMQLSIYLDKVTRNKSMTSSDPFELLESVFEIYKTTLEKLALLERD